MTHRRALLGLIAAVDEAIDLGQDERQEVAWAIAAYWRKIAEED